MNAAATTEKIARVADAGGQAAVMDATQGELQAFERVHPLRAGCR
jgi:hypothetical protein